MTTFIWTISIIFVLITIWAFIYGYISALYPIKREYDWYSENMHEQIDSFFPILLTVFFPVGLFYVVMKEISSIRNPFTKYFTNREKNRKEKEKLKKEIQDIIDGKKEL